MGFTGGRVLRLLRREVLWVCASFGGGRVLRLLQRVGERLIHAHCLEALTTNVRDFFQTNSQMGPAEFKEITGLSRRHAIPLLEWLDTQGVTRREQNYRVLREP